MRLKSLWKILDISCFWILYRFCFQQTCFICSFFSFFLSGEKVLNFMARQSCLPQKWIEMWFGWRFAMGSQEGAVDIDYLRTCIHEKKQKHAFGTVWHNLTLFLVWPVHIVFFEGHAFNQPIIWVVTQWLISWWCLKSRWRNLLQKDNLGQWWILTQSWSPQLI